MKGPDDRIGTSILADGTAPDLSIRGLVLDVDRFASHDGPGIRTAVFLKGCPLACRWCHSPESQLPTPEILFQRERCTACGLCLEACPDRALVADMDRAGAVASVDRGRCTACGRCVEVCYPGALRSAGRSVTVADLVAEIEKDLPYFSASGGGLTLSGGEPAAQFTFSRSLLAEARRRGIHTALETSGYCSWRRLEALASVSDLLLFDLKLVDPAAHLRETGVSNRPILRNLESLAASHPNVQVRVPCITGVNDGEHEIAAVARVAAGSGIRRLALLPYNAAAGAKYEWIDRPYSLAGKQTQSEETVMRLAGLCRAEGLEVQIGG